MTSGNDTEMVQLGQKQENGSSSEMELPVNMLSQLCVCVWLRTAYLICPSSFNDHFAFAFLADGIWTPKLTGRPFQPNVKFYCISNLLKYKPTQLTPLSEENNRAKMILLPRNRAQLLHSVHHVEISGVDIMWWGEGGGAKVTVHSYRDHFPSAHHTANVI